MGYKEKNCMFLLVFYRIKKSKYFSRYGASSFEMRNAHEILIGVVRAIDLKLRPVAY